MERRVLEVKRRNKVDNREMKKRTGCIATACTIRKLKAKCPGHITGADKETWNYIRNMIWTPYDDKKEEREAEEKMTRWGRCLNVIAEINRQVVSGIVMWVEWINTRLRWEPIFTKNEYYIPLLLIIFLLRRASSKNMTRGHSSILREQWCYSSNTKWCSP